MLNKLKAYMLYFGISRYEGRKFSLLDITYINVRDMKCKDNSAYIPANIKQNNYKHINKGEAQYIEGEMFAYNDYINNHTKFNESQINDRYILIINDTIKLSYKLEKKLYNAANTELNTSDIINYGSGVYLINRRACELKLRYFGGEIIEDHIDETFEEGELDSYEVVDDRYIYNPLPPSIEYSDIYVLRPSDELSARFCESFGYQICDKIPEDYLDTDIYIKFNEDGLIFSLDINEVATLLRDGYIDSKLTRLNVGMKFDELKSANFVRKYEVRDVDDINNYQMRDCCYRFGDKLNKDVNMMVMIYIDNDNPIDRFKEIIDCDILYIYINSKLGEDVRFNIMCEIFSSSGWKYKRIIIMNGNYVESFAYAGALIMGNKLGNITHVAIINSNVFIENKSTITDLICRNVPYISASVRDGRRGVWVSENSEYMRGVNVCDMRYYNMVCEWLLGIRDDRIFRYVDNMKHYGYNLEFR